MTRTRMAVVGCGHLGAIHARLLAARTDVELVAVVDPEAGQRERVAEAHGCQGLAEPKALVGLVDAAVVAAPTGLHAAVSLPLLEAGIDLLVEKPLAASAEDARAIVIAARRHGRTVAVGHVERFNPAWRAVADRARGATWLEIERKAPFTFRSLDVGAVHDLMIHDIDLVLSLEPGRLERVEACGLVATGGCEDAVRVRLRFSSGLVADLSASRISPVLVRRLSMWTAAGVIDVDFNVKSVSVVGTSPEVRDGTFVATRVPPEARGPLKERFFTDILPLETVAVSDANAIACEHEDWLDAIRTGRPPLVSAAAGAAAVEVAARVLESLACMRLGSGQRTTGTAPTVPFAARRRTA